jgi:hypothetical protein
MEPASLNAPILTDWLKHTGQRSRKPALSAAKHEVETWLAATASDISAVFVHSDMEIQYQVTAMGLCLSLQAMWERQLRRYLGAYVVTDPIRSKEIHMDHWIKLQTHFEDLRGVPLSAFLWYPDLDLLSRLGNVCRHGMEKPQTVSGAITQSSGHTRV